MQFSMDNAKKFDEGMQHIRNAEKSLKTSFFKWKADYETAADEYTKAATCFKSLKSFTQCREAYIKAANCFKQTDSLFQAAKSLDQAILVSKDMNDLRDVAKLAEEACSLYLTHGSPDTGVLMLDRAATILQTVSTMDSLRLLQHAADVASGQDNMKQAADFMSRVARLFIKLQSYDEAVAALRREMGFHQQAETTSAMGRIAVALVLVHLARRDVVAAEKAFKEWGNCCEAPEIQTLECLLQAYDEEDPEGVKQALNSPFIKHMDVEFARLARDLPIPKVVPTIPAPTIIHNAAPSYVSPNPVDEDQGEKENNDSDMEEGALC